MGAVVDALYLSLVSLTTVGYGDITPLTPWLRIAAPVEGLLGFALLTAAVSWVLQVYPALTRRRVRRMGSVLEDALDELARVLDDQFLHVGGGTERIVDAFREDHGVDAEA
nr:potassium channel family protein [Isoptericola halotolerans]